MNVIIDHNVVESVTLNFMVAAETVNLVSCGYIDMDVGMYTR